MKLLVKERRINSRLLFLYYGGDIESVKDSKYSFNEGILLREDLGAGVVFGGKVISSLSQ